MRKSYGVFVVLMSLATIGAAQDSNEVKPAVQKDPQLLMRTALDQVLTVLRNQELDPQVREKKLGDLVAPLFDFPLMAQLSLGKPHWSKLTPAQQSRFTSLFVERLKDTYRDKLAHYTDEKVIFKPAVLKDKKVLIPTEIVSKEKPFAIVYSLYQVEKTWKVYDVEVEGISLIRTYRSQFDEVLRKGTVEDLFKQLEKPQDPNAPKPG